MIMCVLCYPVSFHMLQLLLTGRPISSFDGHSICLGVGAYSCVLKKDCDLCSVLLAEQMQLSTPTCKSHKEHQKNSSQSPSLINPGSFTVLGQVESDKTADDMISAKVKKAVCEVTN